LTDVYILLIRPPTIARRVTINRVGSIPALLAAVRRAPQVASTGQLAAAVQAQRATRMATGSEISIAAVGGHRRHEVVPDEVRD